MDWEDLRHFHALAETGTLSAAARRLNVEHATVSRRIAALEMATGLKLLDRRGRRLLLTTEGRQIAAIAANIATEVLAVERTSLNAQSELNAEVTISAPPSYAAARLARPLAAIQARHPGIKLRIIGETRHASLDRREADIAIRLSRPAEGELTISKIGEEKFRLFATRDYVDATSPDRWTYIAYGEEMDEAPQQAHLLELAQGHSIELRSNSLEIQLAFVLAGGGVAMLPDFMAMANDTLVEVEPSIPTITRDVWLVVHNDSKDAPAIRAVTASFQKT